MGDTLLKIVTCPTCKHERKVTYIQLWNISNGNSTGNCYSCATKIKQKSPNFGFKKGHINWNAGKQGIFSKKTLKKMRLAKLGKTHTEEQKENQRQKMLGRKVTWGDKVSKARMGMKFSEEHCKNIGLSKSGDKHPFWVGGTKAYRGPDWKEQSMKCIERDENKCRKCGVFGNSLPVHHLIPYRISKSNELKFLITLCPKCHMKLEHEYRRVGITHYIERMIQENILLENKVDINENDSTSQNKVSIL